MFKTINKELKEKLGEELFNQLDEALKDVDVVLDIQANQIPKFRFDEVSAKAKQVEQYADYEDVLAERDTLKAEMEKYADYEDLKAKASKLEEYADYDEIKSKYAEISTNNKRLKLASYGLDEGFVDYALTKEEGENFDEWAKGFVEANPKLMRENFQSIDSSLPLNGLSSKKIEDMDTEEYLVYRQKFEIDGTPKK